MTLDFVFSNTLLILAAQKFTSMGKGDKKSKQGKRWKGSYGVSRNKKSIKARLKRASSKKVGKPKDESKAEKPKKTARKKAE